jgi:hypothetical protein
MAGNSQYVSLPMATFLLAVMGATMSAVLLVVVVALFVAVLADVSGYSTAAGVPSGPSRVALELLVRLGVGS